MSAPRIRAFWDDRVPSTTLLLAPHGSTPNRSSPPLPGVGPATVPPSPALLLPVQLEYDAPMRPDPPSHRHIALHLSVGADRDGAAVRGPLEVPHGVATGRP